MKEMKNVKAKEVFIDFIIILAILAVVVLIYDVMIYGLWYLLDKMFTFVNPPDFTVTTFVSIIVTFVLIIIPAIIRQ